MKENNIYAYNVREKLTKFELRNLGKTPLWEISASHPSAILAHSFRSWKVDGGYFNVNDLFWPLILLKHK